MVTLFAPGCALRGYKPELVEKLRCHLLKEGLIQGEYTTCCKKGGGFFEETRLITCCPGCSHMFLSYKGCEVISLWKVLLDTSFPFPDYQGAKMSIHDSCHARGRNSSEMQESARKLCQRMNITLAEPERTLDDSPCCGGSAGSDYEKRRDMALRRAADFPEKNVVCYCTGCVRSLSITPVVPRHLLDLLFSESTRGLYPPGYQVKAPASSRDSLELS